MRSSVLFLALALLTACDRPGGESSAPPRSEVALVPVARDSAGVTILEHPAGALERAPLIAFDSVPFAEVRGDSTSDDLSRVFAGVALSDGGFAFFDPVRAGVWIVDSVGLLRRVIGRRGEGPGEFEEVESGVARGVDDTLAVTDVSTARVTILHPTGGVVRQAPFERSLGGNAYALNGGLPDGSWVASPSSWVIVGMGAPAFGLERGVPVLHVDPFAAPPRRDSVGFLTSLKAVRVVTKMRGREERGVVIPEFTNPGRGFAWGGKVALYDNHRWELVLTPPVAGGQRSVIRVVDGARHSTPALLDSVAAERRRRSERVIAAGRTPMETPEEAEFNARSTPMAEVVAPFGREYVAPRGTLWLVDQMVPGDPTLGMTALDTAGRLLGRAFLPPSSEIVAVGEDRVLLRHKGEDDVVVLRIHRLRR